MRQLIAEPWATTADRESPSAGGFHYVSGQCRDLVFSQLRAIRGHGADPLRDRALYLSKARTELVEVGAHDAAGIGIGQAVTHTTPRLRLLKK